MASTFSNYVATKHGVAESTLLKATKVGHHYNLVKIWYLDNRCVIHRNIGTVYLNDIRRKFQ